MRRLQAALAQLAEANRSLFRLPKGPGPRGWIALRAALSIGLPFGVLTLLGYQGLGLQAAAGAFVALYSAGLKAGERAKVLPFVALTLLTSAALGVLLAPWEVWLLTGLVVVACVTAALTFAFRLGPPGTVFFVLIYGMAANITAVVDGERINDPWVFLAVLTGGALFSYLLALMPLLRRVERAKPVKPLRELLPGPWMGRDEQVLLVRIVVASIAGAVLTALLLDPHRAYWTVTSAVAVIGLSATRTYSLGRGLHRTVGTLAGSVLYMGLAAISQHALLLVLVITALQFIIEIFVVRNYALALMFITPLVLLITGAAAGNADHFGTASERVLDTALGTVIAIATVFFHSKDPRLPEGK